MLLPSKFSVQCHAQMLRSVVMKMHRKLNSYKSGISLLLLFGILNVVVSSRRCRTFIYRLNVSECVCAEGRSLITADENSMSRKKNNQ